MSNVYLGIVFGEFCLFDRQNQEIQKMQAKIATKIVSYYLNSFGGLLLVYRRHYQWHTTFLSFFLFELHTFLFSKLIYQNNNKKHLYQLYKYFVSKRILKSKKYCGHQRTIYVRPQYLIWSIRSAEVIFFWCTILSIGFCYGIIL